MYSPVRVNKLLVIQLKTLEKTTFVQNVTSDVDSDAIRIERDKDFAI